MVAHPRAEVRADRLRPLNLPRSVKVELGGRGQPRMIIDAPPTSPDSPSSRRGKEGSGNSKVESIGETWRVDDEWWREPISRRYVEVVLEGGGHVVLYEDLTTGDWFIQTP